MVIFIENSNLEGMMRDLHQQQKDFRTTELPSLTANFPIPNAAIWGFFVGVLVTIAVISTNFLNRSFMDSLAPEAIGILVTVLFINQLNRRSEREQYKRRLIHEMGSRVNDVALRATEELRKEGWLEDGSLQVADLSYTNLQRAYLSRVNLQSADVSHANLKAAHLFGVNLQGAKLREANLQSADVSYANLKAAHLFGVNLQGADLRGANLQEANLGVASLQEANLGRVSLQKAYLLLSNLQGAYLNGANLQEASLESVRNVNDAFFDENTTLPNGDKWHEGYNLAIFTDAEHPNFWEPEWIKELSEQQTVDDSNPQG